jgi:hypothetical protein
MKFPPAQHRCLDDERGDDQPERNSIRDSQSVEHHFLIDCVDFQPKLIVTNRIQNAVDAREATSLRQRPLPKGYLVKYFA